MSARLAVLGARLPIGLLPIGLLLGFWHVAAVSGLAPASLLPTPGAVLGRLIGQVGDPVFLGHAVATLFRLACGFLVALVLGVSLGLAAATRPRVEAVLRPLVRVLAPVPKIALYPVLILTLGFRDAPKIVLVAADALFPILLATLQGAKAVEPKLVWSARAAGTSATAVIYKVVLPATLPAILTGCRIGLVVSCIVVFLAEMISSTDGLGYLLVKAARSFAGIDMFVPVVAISIVGLALNGLLAAARARLLAGFPDES